jgi:hypothetical protein
VSFRLPQPEATLSVRDLNRAALARQMLLSREEICAVEGVERVAGLQAQYSPSPYIALWSRLAGFHLEQLTEALHERKLVKASLMRWTLHIVSARDFPYFNRAAVSARHRSWRRYTEQWGWDIDSLHAALLDFASEPRPQLELEEFLNELVPSHPTTRERNLAWAAVRSLGGLVHTPPSGIWKYFGKCSYVRADRWLDGVGAPSLEEANLHLVQRYLAAFGPASRRDILQWSGLQLLTTVDEALRLLGDEIVAFKDEDHNVLYDLRDAPRPGADVPAPPRFLPKWDNLLLAYDNRERVLPDRYRKIIIKVNGDVLPTFLVDGVVAGTWAIERQKDSATLKLEPLEHIKPPARVGLEEEGEQLLRFVEPDAKAYSLKWVT